MHLDEDRAGFAEVVAARRTSNERFLARRRSEPGMPEASTQGSSTYQKRACRDERVSFLKRQGTDGALHQCIEGPGWQIVEYSHKVFCHLVHTQHPRL